MNAARLLFPALRWDKTHGFGLQDDQIQKALDLGVGGFILFGGEASAVRTLTRELQAASRHPLLIGSDFERGVGQQFAGATPLPPAAALGWLDDLEATEEAGFLTAQEARSLGVGWIYSPVADVGLEPANPIIGTRAFGADPARTAAHVAAWVRGCERGGALACAKHFPGHGRTLGDSHLTLPAVDVSAEAMEADLLPFRMAIEGGLSSLMTAHVAYPALDPSNRPATLSRPILHTLLRERLGFRGIVVSDALVMEGFAGAEDEGAASVSALAAGCDALLYPRDLAGVAHSLQAALAAGLLDPARVEVSCQRIHEAALRTVQPLERPWAQEEDRRRVLEIARRSVHVVRGSPALPGETMQLWMVDDDFGGPFPPFSRTGLGRALSAAGYRYGYPGPIIIAAFCDIRAWKGRAGFSERSLLRIRTLLARAPEATVLLFGHPRLADEIPEARHVLSAWGGEVLMQEAAVAHLAGTRGALCSTAPGLIT